VRTRTAPAEECNDVSRVFGFEQKFQGGLHAAAFEG
jgi:hypothetical protein